MTPSQILLTVKACVLLTLLVVVGVTCWRLGGASGRVALAEYRTKVMASTARAADLATKASELARKAEQAKAIEIAVIAKTYEDKRNEIEADSARRVADLESGNLRLRKLWAGSETKCLSETAASTAELAGQDRLRRESTERIVRAVETVQAQRDGLRAVTEADRK